MCPESAEDNTPSQEGGSLVYSPVVRAFFDKLLEPGVHGSHVVRDFEAGREPFAPLVQQLNASSSKEIQQRSNASEGGKTRAENIAEVHAKWQSDAEDLWKKEQISVNKTAEILNKRYKKEYQDAAPDDKEEIKRYARSHHTIRKFIRKP